VQAAREALTAERAGAAGAAEAAASAAAAGLEAARAEAEVMREALQARPHARLPVTHRPEVGCGGLRRASAAPPCVMAVRLARGLGALPGLPPAARGRRRLRLCGESRGPRRRRCGQARLCRACRRGADAARRRQAAADRIQAAAAAEAAAARAAEDRAEDAADARRRAAELEGRLSVAEGLQARRTHRCLVACSRSAPGVHSPSKRC